MGGVDPIETAAVNPGIHRRRSKRDRAPAPDGGEDRAMATAAVSPDAPISRATKRRAFVVDGRGVSYDRIHPTPPFPFHPWARYTW